MSDPREDFKNKVIRNESAAAHVAQKCAALATEVKAREDDMARLRVISDSESARQCISLDVTKAVNSRLDIEYEAIQRIDTEMFGKMGPVVNLTTVGPTGVYAISQVSFTSDSDAAPDVQNLFHVYDQRQQAAFEEQQVVARLRQKLVDLECVRSHGSSGATNIEQLDEAWKKYQNPSNGRNDALGPLLGMRECLDGILDSLNKKLPNHLQGKKAPGKVRAILSGLAAEQLDEQVVERMAIDAKEIHDQLSSEGKPNALDRVRTHLLLQRATYFLRDLLNMIDTSRCCR